MDLIGGPKLSKMFATIRAAVFGIRTTRDFPAAGDTAAQTVVSATYAILPGANSIFDLNGAPSVSMRIVTSDGTATDKVAIKIYGSVNGTDFVDVHELITGSADPIINDYGAIDQVIEASLGLRQIAVYAKYTSGAGTTGTVRVYWQPKFDTVAVNQAALIQKVVAACFDLSRGQVGANITNWPSNNGTPYNFLDNGGVATAAATYYLPSSTGMSLQGIKSLSITGKLISGTADNTLTFSQEVCNDEDLAGDWEQIQFLDDTTGNVVDSFTVVNATQNLCIPNREIGAYQNYRIKLVVANTGVLTNTISIKGFGVGGA